MEGATKMSHEDVILTVQLSYAYCSFIILFNLNICVCVNICSWPPLLYNLKNRNGYNFDYLYEKCKTLELKEAFTEVGKYKTIERGFGH